LGLQQAAEAIGFSAAAGKIREGQFENLPLPAILHTNGEGYGHFVVLYKRKPNELCLVDPAKGFVRIEASRFRKLWTEYALILQPSDRFVSAAGSNSPLKLVWEVVIRKRWLLGVSSILSVVVTLTAFATAWILKSGIDQVTRRVPMSSLTLLAIGLTLAAFFEVLSVLARDIVMVAAGKALELEMGVRFMQKVYSLPVRFFEIRSAGDVVSRMIDISNVRQTIINSFLSLALDLALLLCTGAALLLYNLSLASIALLLLPLIALLLALTSRWLLSSQREARDSVTTLANTVIEAIEHIRLFKVFTAEREVLDRITDLYDRSQGALQKSSLATSFGRSLGATVSDAVWLLTLVIGTKLVYSGRISVGQLLFFYSTVGIYTAAAERIPPAFGSLQEALVGAERVAEFSREPPEVEPGSNKPQLSDVDGEIFLQEVSYAYRRGCPVLRELSLVIHPGEVVAVVGETGAGKSTLASLIAGLIVPTEGCIYIGSRPHTSFDATQLRRYVSIVFQDGVLLNTTLRHNIALGCSSAPDEDIVQFSKLAGAHDFIMRLPNNYNYRVGAQGGALSSGQKQRIALARALLRKSPILILDEATSNLDTETEADILNAVLTRSDRPTTILITHRLRAAALADNIVVLHQGRIVEAGPHHQLLSSGDHYQRMWRCQGLAESSGSKGMLAVPPNSAEKFKNEKLA
jgi:ABC-type bacteriocin/lantibiotic exporter with double-glycine peptidase domain